MTILVFDRLVATQPALTLEVELELDMLARMRWQALLSVEDLIREAHTLVDELGAMERTIWLYTSCDPTACAVRCFVAADVLLVPGQGSWLPHGPAPTGGG